MTVTTTTTMTPMPKPRLRVCTEPMPAHCLIAPEGAPACYGDSAARSPGCWIRLCSRYAECSDFLERTRSDAKLSRQPEGAGRRRVVWPDDAPIIIDEEHFRARAFGGDLQPKDVDEEKLWRCVDQPFHNGTIAHAVRAAYRGGLIPVHPAIDIAQEGELLNAWLAGWTQRERGVVDPDVTALIWAIAEVTWEALRVQGRPHAFRPKFLHDVWCAININGPRRTRNALRKRLPHVEMVHEAIRGGLMERFLHPPLGAPRDNGEVDASEERATAA